MMGNQSLEEENAGLRQKVIALENQLAQVRGEPHAPQGEVKRQPIWEVLATLVEIEQSLAAPLDQNQIYSALNTGILRLFPDITTIIISRFDAERQMIVPVYALHDGQNVDISVLPELPLAPPGRGTQSRVIHTRQPLLISSGLREKLSSTTLVRVGPPDDADNQSALYVPMLAQNQVMGIIQLQSLVCDRFQDDDVLSLSLIANTAAVSLQNAQLHHTAQAEIRERQQTAEALAESIKTVQALINAVSESIFLIDIDGKVLAANETFATRMRHSLAELIGTNVYPFIPPKLASSRKKVVLAAVETGQLTTFIDRRNETWIEHNLYPIRDSDGQIRRVAIYSPDITKRKQAEEEIRASEEKYRALASELEQRVKERTAELEDLYNHAPCGYHSLDADGYLLHINDTELNWLGYSREEIIGHSILEVLVPESQAIFKARFPQSKIDGGVKDLELEYRRKDGSTFPILVSAQHIYDASGKFVMSRSTMFDRTARKEVEDALRASEEQNRLLFEESPDAIILLSRNGKIIRVNRAYEQMIKFTREEMIGRHAGTIGMVSAEVQRFLTDAVRQAGDRHLNYVTAEHTLNCADGSTIHVESRIFLLKIRGIDHILITMRDISTRKLAEEMLRQANLEMERAIRMKDEFLASMSHELRTPLTGILGIAESLQDFIYGPLNEKQLRALLNIENSGQHLLDLINDILDVSKLEAGKLQLQVEPCSLGAICQASLQMIKGMAAKKDQKVFFRMNQDQIEMLADPRRIKQILVNLLSNAVKYSPEGGELGLEVNGDPARQTVQMVVWDHGIGIKKEDLDKLFKPFIQLDSSLARQQTGTGLGLMLVKQLAELHDGYVQVESSPSGSRFTVTIAWVSPVPHEPVLEAVGAAGSDHLGQTKEALLAAAAARNLVMLVDDDELNLQAISDYLLAKGFLVITARNAQDFFERLSYVHPNVILMDIQMPGMDGLEVIRKVKSGADHSIQKIPIIAITALAMSGDRERCLNAGADEYVSKPVRLKQLTETIIQLTR